MLRELEDDDDQETVEKVITGLEPGGVTGSAAWVELREAVVAAGRTEEWNEIVTGVRQGFEARGLDGAEAITPAFLGSGFRQLQGVGEFTAEHYDALTTSWRTHVRWTHPEDESLKPGEQGVYGCGEPPTSRGSWADFARGPHA
jgi:hypothetical protein